MQRELNVLALVKGVEHYVFVYDDASGPALVDSFRRWAADERLSFNWFDATVLTEKSQQQLSETTPLPLQQRCRPAQAPEAAE